jgi:hypothetical protein
MNSFVFNEVTMGHATHFLRRLQRASTSQVEVAKQLYYNPRLVQAILLHFKVERAFDPEERVAIALDSRQNPPHVIVNRRGDFITCLGPGMGLGNCPVMTRQTLDGLMHFHRRLRMSFEYAPEIVEQDKALNDLGVKICLRPDEFCREDLGLLMNLQPILMEKFYRYFARAAENLRERRFYLIRAVRKNPAKAARHRYHRPLLRNYWENLWAVANNHIFLNLGGYMDFIGMFDISDGDPLDLLHTEAMTDGQIAASLRALWGAARRGPFLIGEFEKLLETADTITGITICVANLVVIALHNEELRDDIENILRKYPVSEDAPYKNGCCALGLHVLEAPEKAMALHRNVGRSHYEACYGHFKPDHPFYFSSPDDIPDDLAMTIGAHPANDFRTDSGCLNYFFCCLPWVAMTEAQDLFLPRALMLSGDTAESAAMMLAHYSKLFRPSQPIRVDPTPGRNEHCSCGSGNKFKRCCGLMEHAL